MVLPDGAIKRIETEAKQIAEVSAIMKLPVAIWRKNGFNTLAELAIKLSSSIQIGTPSVYPAPFYWIVPQEDEFSFLDTKEYRDRKGIAENTRRAYFFGYNPNEQLITISPELFKLPETVRRKAIWYALADIDAFPITQATIPDQNIDAVLGITSEILQTEASKLDHQNFAVARKGFLHYVFYEGNPLFAYNGLAEPERLYRLRDEIHSKNDRDAGLLLFETKMLTDHLNELYRRSIAITTAHLVQLASVGGTQSITHTSIENANRLFRRSIDSTRKNKSKERINAFTHLHSNEPQIAELIYNLFGYAENLSSWQMFLGVCKSGDFKEFRNIFQVMGNDFMKEYFMSQLGNTKTEQSEIAIIYLQNLFDKLLENDGYIVNSSNRVVAKLDDLLANWRD